MHSNADPPTESETTSRRRRFLQALGGAGLAGAAGCADLTGDDTDDTDGSEAVFEVRDLEPVDATVTAVDPLTVSATIENTGDEAGAQLVEYRVDGEAITSQSVTLDAGATDSVSFADLDLTTDFEAGEYDHGVYSTDDDATGTLTIPSSGPPMPPRADYEGIVGLHPEDAEKSFSVADGFEVELVASEPLIDSPVDIRWDADGRLWVVEMPDYMAIHPDDDRGGEEPGNWSDGPDAAERDLETLTGWEDSKSDEPPNGAVKILEDTDGDGVMDTATTFKDTLTLPRSLALVDADDGLLIGQAGQNVDAPDLLVCRDTDGDGVADADEVLVESWVDPTSTEHTNNGLEYMLDNWLYSSYTTDRIQYRDGLEMGTANSDFGQWGLTEDDYGRTFHTWNSNLLDADLGPGKGVNTTSISDDNTVYPIRPSPGTNRYFEDQRELRDDGRLESPTAVSGPAAYRGHLFSETFRNDVFSPEPQAACVAHLHLEDEAGGLGITSSHETYGYTAENNPYEDDLDELDAVEFLASWDEVFKPVNIRTGPDGALYIVDMYNGLFQHWIFLTAHLADYYYENRLWEIDHLEHGTGRIWRITPEDADLETPPALGDLGPAELVAELGHDNGWVRRTAQRLLVQGAETDAVDPLRDLAQEGDDDRARMHALWTLHGLDAIDADSVFAVLDEADDSHILANAMHAGEPLLETDARDAYLDRLETFADHDHERIAAQANTSLEQA